MEREKAISYSHRIRLNGGCVFVIGSKLCCLSGTAIVRISLRWGGRDRK